MISIVIPVYNAAATLDRCLGSVAAQTYGDYELLLVDDGSTDGSLEICRVHAASNPRIRVLTKPNGGPASTRNFGLDHCDRGSEWVTFIDSDDSVTPDYLQTLIEAQGDLRVSGLNHIYPGKEISSLPLYEGKFGLHESLKSNPTFAAVFENGIMSPPWGKLFSLSIIRANHLRMREIRTLEDADFVFRYVTRCQSVSIIPRATYNYIHRTGSETSSPAPDAVDNYIRLHGEMLAWFSADCHPAVDRFVYPQYLGITLRHLRTGDLTAPRRWLSDPLVQRAFSAHSPVSLPDRVLNRLIAHRWLRMAKWLFI